VTGSELPHESERAEGVPDLLGMLAYATLSAFFKLADDAAGAESLSDKMALAGMAVDEYGHFREILGRLAELHVDPDAAMQPFVPAFDEFYARTVPSDWLEGLVKIYVGEGIAAGFSRAVADLLDPRTRELVQQVLPDTGQADFVVERVRQAIESDPQVAGRLSLWARRLIGEALGNAQRVAAEREPLARLLAGGDAGQLGEISRMLAKLADEHSQRVAKLGLTGHSAAS
jgi:tRNA-(MS[2]IO[6]A)-hydroxylase (MiaE)-like